MPSDAKTIQFHLVAGQRRDNLYKNAQEKREKSMHMDEKWREVLEEFLFMGTKIPKGWEPRASSQQTRSLTITFGSLSTRRIWATDDDRKWTVFQFNLSSHNDICIVKYLFTSRDD